MKKAYSYEVLVAKHPDLVDWTSSSGGSIPPNSVIGGIDCSYLEPLYVGRTVGSLGVGRTWRGQRLWSSSHVEVGSLFSNACVIKFFLSLEIVCCRQTKLLKGFDLDTQERFIAPTNVFTFHTPVRSICFVNTKLLSFGKVPLL